MQPVWDRWIELEEEERNVGGLLCMTMSDGEDALPIIKGGVVEQLVERLTHAGFPDPEYVTAFLLTYRSFIEPEDLMDMLIKNFTVPEPASHKDREFLEYFHDTVRKPIQFRYDRYPHFFLSHMLSLSPSFARSSEVCRWPVAHCFTAHSVLSRCG